MKKQIIQKILWRWLNPQKYIYCIDEVHEIPGENRAEVRVTYIAKNKTPFAILLPKKERNLDTIKIPKPMIFRKTNSGWEFCDN